MIRYNKGGHHRSGKSLLERHYLTMRKNICMENWLQNTSGLDNSSHKIIAIGDTKI